MALISTYLVSTFFSIYVPFPSEAIGTFLATLQYLVKKLRTFLMIGFLDRNSIERKGTHWYLPIVYLYRRQQTFLVPLCKKFGTYWVVYLFWDLLCTYSFYSVFHHIFCNICSTHSYQWGDIFLQKPVLHVVQNCNCTPRLTWSFIRVHFRVVYLFRWHVAEHR